MADSHCTTHGGMARLSLPGWLVTAVEINFPTPGVETVGIMVTHPSTGWLRGSAVERRSLAVELYCPALDL